MRAGRATGEKGEGRKERGKEKKKRKRKMGKRKKKEGREKKGRERERDSRRNRRSVGHARRLGARERDARVEGEIGRWIWLSGLGSTGIGRSGGKRESSEKS